MAILKTVHFIGIGGIHMSGLAGILLTDGAQVTGSDLVRSHLTDHLEALGAKITIGHDSSNIGEPDLVVSSLAISNDNPEIVATLTAGIELISRAEMVARIAANSIAITISGSHGKTTTTAMVACSMQNANLDPTYILGGEIIESPIHAARGSGPHIVIEADEYGRAFHEYDPTIAVITNIERDHLDYYGNDESLYEAFVKYADTLLLNGTLIVGGESVEAVAVANRIANQRPDIVIQTFGIDEEKLSKFDWSAHSIIENTTNSSFVIDHPSGKGLACRLQTPGKHNVRNALAALAASSLAEAEIEAVVQAFAEFRGVRRRFEKHAEVSGILILDDYAHHPGEIIATIEAVKTRYPNRRIIVLFQPHTYSRSLYLLDGFKRCFCNVDHLYLTNTYAAREQSTAGLSAIDLAAHIQTPPAVYTGSLEDSVAALVPMLKLGDVVITMGAGDVNHAGPMITQMLEDR